MMVIEYLVGDGLMIHFQVPFSAEKPGQGKYSIGPSDGSLLCPVSEVVAAALIAKCYKIKLYPNGEELYREQD